MVPHPPLIVPDIGRGESIRFKAQWSYGHGGIRYNRNDHVYADYSCPGEGAKGDFGQLEQAGEAGSCI